jgi:glycosyl transferase family 25
MKVYLINLDRHKQRLQRMEQLLQGMAFERVPAVDGKYLAGQERRDAARPIGADNLTRYELACFQSHRAAWSRLVASGEPFGCVLEDDVSLSPDFPKFMADVSWIPAATNVVKIDTFCEQVLLSCAKVGALDRILVELRSQHLGTSAYILSRRGAEILLAETCRPCLPVDIVVFGTDVLRQHGPLLQIVPALSIQTRHVPGGILFEEMQSSIQFAPVKPCKSPVKPYKSPLKRIRLEVCRPFLQLQTAARRLFVQLRAKAQYGMVPYA